jgi:hypothetical protein
MPSVMLALSTIHGMSFLAFVSLVASAVKRLISIINLIVMIPCQATAMIGVILQQCLSTLCVEVLAALDNCVRNV